MKKRRRKKSIPIDEKKSSTVQIQVNSSIHSSPSSSFLINHRPTCRLYQPTESPSGLTHPPTPSSMYLYSIDAPAASPELSDGLDATPTATLNAIPHSPMGNSSIASTLTPILIKSRTNKASETVELTGLNPSPTNPNNNNMEGLSDEPQPKKLSIQFCECHREDISDDDDILDHDDDDDDNYSSKKKKKQSKCSLLCDRYCCSHLSRFRQLIIRFVASKYFRRIVLSAIVVNTLSMGIEYHGQPQSLTNALEYSNLVFTTLFAIEMVLKIIAEGCLKYIKNAYNLFDSGIVIMSIVELQGNKNSGLSVLRTFRLLRVLKLVRFMPTLRRQLVSRTIDSLTNKTTN